MVFAVIAFGQFTHNNPGNVLCVIFDASNVDHFLHLFKPSEVPGMVEFYTDFGLCVD